ncbi:hypothetical protein RQM65_06980 [Pricia sp. S334]|uniref:Antitoxin n=1 Tax=Pricia mediterranea TaxID=3076079 RepID=A0ABU3L3S6_9FLAO|nr:hypothetical protein [Pricia sp. S334]MDT7828400.1 hypothetical protein [Pricia sp. S334]
MEKVRKLIDVDHDVVKILEEEARKQKRSLKSLLEYTIEETARKLESPSAEYRTMIEDMLKKLDEGQLEFTSIDEIKSKYGL